jgi:NitT/TauT family transport system substrate-binding protein
MVAELSDAMPIRLAENFRAVFYAPYYAAQALGLYEREGVDVTFLESSAPGAGASGLIDGTIDVTWGGPMRVMKANDGPSSPLVCFCEVVARDPFYLVGRPDLHGFRLVDLPSLRFAAVSEVPTPWLCLQHDLREQGIDPALVDRAPARTMAANFAALCQGELDVIQVFEPYPTLALHSGAGRILYAASTRGPTVYTAFITTRGAIGRHHAAFPGMVRAMRHMQGWLIAHEADELAELTAPFFPQIARDVLAGSLRRYREAGLWARAPAVSRQGFARLAESLVSGGFISAMPRYEECVAEDLV